MSIKQTLIVEFNEDHNRIIHTYNDSRCSGHRVACGIDNVFCEGYIYKDSDLIITADDIALMVADRIDARFEWINLGGVVYRPSVVIKGADPDRWEDSLDTLYTEMLESGDLIKVKAQTF